jgi:hypothetical protein
MSLETYTHLLKDLGIEIGIPDLTPDETGYCSLILDQTLMIEMMWVEDTQHLVLFSRLGAYDISNELEIFRELLLANSFWRGTEGATLGVDGDLVFLARRISLSGINFKAFHLIFESFSRVAQFWTHKIIPHPSNPLEPGSTAVEAIMGMGDPSSSRV